MGREDKLKVHAYLTFESWRLCRFHRKTQGRRGQRLEQEKEKEKEEERDVEKEREPRAIEEEKERERERQLDI